MTSTHYCLTCHRPFEVDIPLDTTVNMRIPTHCPEHRVNVVMEAVSEPIDSKSQNAFRAQTANTDNKHHRRHLDITISGPTGEGKTLLAILIMSLLRHELDVGDPKQLLLQLLGEDDPDNLPCVADAVYMLRSFALQEGLDITIRTAPTPKRRQAPSGIPNDIPMAFTSSEAYKLLLNIAHRGWTDGATFRHAEMMLEQAAFLIDFIQMSLTETLGTHERRTSLPVGTRNCLTRLLDTIKRGHP